MEQGAINQPCNHLTHVVDVAVVLGQYGLKLVG